jgi:hypothetical protein
MYLKTWRLARGKESILLGVWSYGMNGYLIIEELGVLAGVMDL